MQQGMSYEDRRWMEGRLDTMEARLSKRIDDAHAVATVRLNDHSKRLRTLELWRSWLTGLAAAAGAAGSWVVQMFRDGRG